MKHVSFKQQLSLFNAEPDPIPSQITRCIAVYGYEAATHTYADHLPLVESIYSAMVREKLDPSYTFADFAASIIPHVDPAGPRAGRNKAINGAYRRHFGDRVMLINAGSDYDGNPLPIPNGKYAKLIMIYLCTEAIKTKKATIVTGDTLNGWIRKLGISLGGTTTQSVTAQLHALSAATFSFFTANQPTQKRTNLMIVDQQLTFRGTHDWQGQITLSQPFYSLLLRQPVQLSEAAIAALSNDMLALDIYSWLAFHGPRIADDETHEYDYATLCSQFSDRASLKGFKGVFLDALAKVLGVYQHAAGNVQVDQSCIRLTRFPEPLTHTADHTILFPRGKQLPIKSLPDNTPD